MGPRSAKGERRCPRDEEQTSQASRAQDQGLSLQQHLQPRCSGRASLGAVAASALAPLAPKRPGVGLCVKHPLPYLVQVLNKPRGPQPRVGPGPRGAGSRDGGTFGERTRGAQVVPSLLASRSPPFSTLLPRMKAAVLVGLCHLPPAVGVYADGQGRCLNRPYGFQGLKETYVVVVTPWAVAVNIPHHPEIHRGAKKPNAASEWLACTDFFQGPGKGP